MLFANIALSHLKTIAESSYTGKYKNLHSTLSKTHPDIFSTLGVTSPGICITSGFQDVCMSDALFPTRNAATFLLLLLFTPSDRLDTQFDVEYLFFMRMCLSDPQSVFHTVDVL